MDGAFAGLVLLAVLVIFAIIVVAKSVALIPQAEAAVIERIRRRLGEVPELAFTFRRPTLFSFKTPIEVEVYRVINIASLWRGFIRSTVLRPDLSFRVPWSLRDN